MVPLDTFYRDHWVEVAEERHEVYEQVFAWSPELEPLIAPAGFGPDQVVVDYGCGPGQMCVELAKRVGPGGHVHAMDINEKFVRRTRERAQAEGLTDRITVHHMSDDRLPFEDGSIDRILCKNVLKYVDDPLASIQDCHRVLAPGGRLHVTDNDWGFYVFEPLSQARTAALISAASHAYKSPLLGRKLYGLCQTAGYSTIDLGILPTIDTDGQFAGVIRNIASYARAGGSLPEAEIDAVMAEVD
ncbi:MAG: methyltransferase domain-containing protein, partial [Rhodospirillaceae bacterium]|nr:methyltransferase domain-containing protein [Rhodospirillaceae bacterium]